MGILAAAFVAGAMCLPGAVVSGTVVDESGAPVAGAQVFLETGVEAPLVAVRTAPDGAFRFPDVPQGKAGVFAIADGLAFGGKSPTVTGADAVSGLRIALAPPDTLSGVIENNRGRPVDGARVTGVLLVGEKVGIPFTKLESYGFAPPVSDAKGRFTVERLPKGGLVALKVTHPDYAQEEISDARVGGATVSVEMTPGVLVRGKVVARSGRTPVANATLLIRSAHPPHATLTTRTGLDGSFAAHLKPGVYGCQAVATELRTPGWERLTVTGESPTQDATVSVAAIARVFGEVNDAKTGSPIANARVMLGSMGRTISSVRTDAGGRYEILAAAGDNTIALEGAPGYLPAVDQSVSMRLGEGDATEMPVFWLMPIPEISVRVVDSAGRALPGAAISLLSPRAFGWRFAGPDGTVTLRLGSVRMDGTVVGLAEHPAAAEGALFRIQAAETQNVTVQLTPWASVTGRVISSRKGLEGAVTGAVLAGTDDEPVVVWRTIARKDGSFAWPASPAGAAIKCVAYGLGEAAAESAAFTPEPGSPRQAPEIEVADGTRGVSLFGKRMDFGPVEHVSGPAFDPDAGRPAVVCYCTAEQAGEVAGALAIAAETGMLGDTAPVVVVNGPAAVDARGVHVLRGTAPGHATVYVTDADGRVVFETLDLPPAHVFRTVLQSSGQGT